MARARNIKPGFFSNDLLAECDPLARILFAGLWTIADRAGRLEDRPKKIKAELLPYDNCDANEYLSELEKHGFIIRYEVDNTKYIQVLNFDKHQNPHKNEAPSTIPEPEQHSTRTVQEPEQHSTNRADSLNLIPDSNINTLSACASSENLKELENLTVDDFKEFLLQREMVGRPVTLDLREELERFKTHYLAANGEDRNRNKVFNWKKKFENWILNDKSWVKNEKINRRNTSISAVSAETGKSKWDVAGEKIFEELDAGVF